MQIVQFNVTTLDMNNRDSEPEKADFKKNKLI